MLEKILKQGMMVVLVLLTDTNLSKPPIIFYLHVFCTETVWSSFCLLCNKTQLTLYEE